MRIPNPWFLIPTLIGTVVGAGLGWAVAVATCRPDTCVGAATTWAIIAGLVSLVGFGTVVSLAIRSAAEFNAATEAGLPEPEAGCEAADDGS